MPRSVSVKLPPPSLVISRAKSSLGLGLSRLRQAVVEGEPARDGEIPFGVDGMEDALDAARVDGAGLVAGEPAAHLLDAGLQLPDLAEVTQVLRERDAGRVQRHLVAAVGACQAADRGGAGADADDAAVDVLNGQREARRLKGQVPRDREQLVVQGLLGHGRGSRRGPPQRPSRGEREIHAAAQHRRPGRRRRLVRSRRRLGPLRGPGVGVAF